MAAENLDRSLVSGIGWTALSRWLSQIVSWAATLYAARHLKPGDYGLVSMAMLPIGLVRLIEDFGFDTVLVQNRQLDRQAIARLGGLVLIVALLLTAGLAIVAPAVARFFAEPLLTTLIMLGSTMILFDAIQVVPRALLQRELRYRTLAFIYLAQVIVTSAVLVLAARGGVGAPTLILNNISGALIATILLVLAAPLLPRWPRGLRALRDPLLQGWRMIVSRGAWYGYSSADSTAIGRFLGKDALGHYSFAVTFSNTAVQEVTALVTRVVPGIFSSAQKDPAALRRYFLLLTEAIAYIAFPMCAGVALTADVLVAAALGPQWGDVVDPLRVLCLYVAITVAQILVSHVLLWTGRFRANMWLSLFALLVIPIAVVIGAQFSITGVAWALAIGFPIASLPGAVLAVRAIQLPWQDYGRALLPPTVACAAMAAVVLLVRPYLPPGMEPLKSLGLQALAGATTYIVALAVVYRDRVRVLYDLIRSAGAS
ncbi:MAG: lipopolysaccharide biosynthesis protein [Steroidobacteraceae bacterium]